MTDSRMMIEFKNLTVVLAQVISELPAGIPSGHLFVQLMGMTLPGISFEYSLDIHNEVIATLERGGLITVKAHYIEKTQKLVDIFASKAETVS